MMCFLTIFQDGLEREIEHDLDLVNGYGGGYGLYRRADNPVTDPADKNRSKRQIYANGFADGQQAKELESRIQELEAEVRFTQFCSK